jgi:putative N6-adenine-specific DNA methylase
MSFDFFLPCPRGLEASLATELAEIAAKHLNGAPFTAGAQVPGGVHFRGGWAAGMAAPREPRPAENRASAVSQRTGHLRARARTALGAVVLGERNAARRRHRDQVAAAQPRIHDAARQGRDLRPSA